MISIITPTHNPKYINELWETIKNQTYKDWEWVIITNNGAKVDIKDDRVRIIDCPHTLKSVGFLKKYGFLQAKGDLIAEVDHDDLLTPDCLEEVVKAFDNETGFVYSDNAKLGKFTPYNPKYGWTYKMFEWQGQELYSMNSFEPSARAFAFIWYAPDHIRVWKKSVYMEIGGHDDELDVLDDHDLLIRTYLKTKCKRISKCLYIYRITGDNTWIQRNQKIQTGTVELYKKYAFQLAEREAELRGLRKIDLCGGFDKPKGYESIDLINGDIKADLNEKWPLGDGSVGVIRAYDAIEHLKDKQFTMSEAYRVLSSGGWLMIAVPSTDGRGAFQDPTHISYWNENSFWYYTREQSKYIHSEPIFDEFRLETIFPSEWHKLNNIPYTYAFLRKK